MRITGGVARGITLVIPARGEIRPTTDAVREAVFSSLGDLVVGARVFDAFAGTGAYALEALSRGAEFACLADKNPRACEAQRKNFASVVKSILSRGKPAPTAKFLNLDLLKPQSVATTTVARANLIFCDPPWVLWSEQSEKISKLVEWFTTVVATNAESTRLILESPAATVPPTPEGWELVSRIFKRKGNDSPMATILKRLPAT